MNKDMQTWKPTKQLFKEIAILLAIMIAFGLIVSFLGSALLNWLT